VMEVSNVKEVLKSILRSVPLWIDCCSVFTSWLLTSAAVLVVCDPVTLHIVHPHESPHWRQTIQSLSARMNAHSIKYKCTECGKCFGRNRDLRRHRRIHSEEKPFECSVCSKRFTEAGTLVTHSRVPKPDGEAAARQIVT